MTRPRRAPLPSALSILAFVLLALAPAAADTTSCGKTTCANVCDQTYALCIAATCTPDEGGTTATCACTVETGWSVGPGTCGEREPIVDGATLKLTSTFSTALYTTQPFYNGSGQNADCYGQPCTSTDEETATCTCKLGGGPQASWWSEAACTAPPEGSVYSGASSPFGDDGLGCLAALIATCSDTTAPAPQACDED